MTSLTVVNAATATFDCSFGRGCEGLCCKQGEPSVSAAEQATIETVLPRLREHLRPAALKMIDEAGWLSGEIKLGQPMIRTEGEWCVFFNAGCTLHKLGMLDGDFAQYKPTQCVLFPLEPNGDGTWYVRQWHENDEQWNDLFCLNPANTPLKAVETLAPELIYAERLGPDFTWPATTDDPPT